MDAAEQKEKVAGFSERQFRDFVVDEFRADEARHTQLAEAIEKNTALTQQNVDATAGLVNIFKGAAMGVGAFAWTGRMLRKAWKILQPFVILGAAAWVASGGKWPSWLKPPGG